VTPSAFALSVPSRNDAFVTLRFEPPLSSR
jgi:hypothetical protein